MSKSNYISIILGAAVGTLAGYFVAKKKYEQTIRELVDELDDTVAQYNEKYKERLENDEESETPVKPAKEEMNSYKDVIANSGYAKGYIKEKNKNVDKPYVIRPEEFGEFENYETISLTYYSDGVLADECDEVVDDIEEIVGFESLTHFGEYEDDSVFVRNDAKSCDYEILKDFGTYADMMKKRPH
ncbi:MAG: YtxH domain-containing protein [Lachnospiraceae bacterium]|nr:YtxH domain-containing protein [Lachnospiraceae bacterium]